MTNATSLDAAARCALIERNTAELLTRDELLKLLESNAEIRHYIGFEISGLIHAGYLLCAAKIRDFMAAGVKCHVLLADWHTWINDKLGGDREVIRSVAGGYFAEGIRAALRCVGGDPDGLTFVLGSDLYHHNDDYWATLIEVCKHTSLARMQRSISIMGRSEGDNVDFAKLIYPPMQVADIFSQGIHLAHAGMDQRKAHVVARDVALQMRFSPLRNGAGEQIKPIAVHHPLLLGLRKPPVWPLPEGANQRDTFAAMKMSKSDPASALYIHDDPETIARKVAKAFCPPGELVFNPIIDWIRRLVFDLGEQSLRIDRSVANGGTVTFDDIGEVEVAYAAGNLHPADAKQALVRRLTDLLEPARRHFAEPARAAMLEELRALAQTPARDKAR